MKNKHLVLSVSLGLLVLCLLLGAGVREVSAEDIPEPVLRHVVLFQFKEGITPEQINEVEAAFCRLPKEIDLIQDFEWGTNVSPENLDQGYTHCFLLTFKTEEDRNDYLPHPAHKEFGKVLRPYLEKVCVIDYWTKS